MAGLRAMQPKFAGPHPYSLSSAPTPSRLNGSRSLGQVPVLALCSSSGNGDSSCKGLWELLLEAALAQRFLICNHVSQSSERTWLC